MDNSSKLISGILAGIFAILFVMTTALAFLLYNVERSLFDAELYIQAFEKENLYQRLPKLSAEALTSAAQEAEPGDPLALMRNLTEEQWETFLTEILPPDELENLAEDSVTQIMAFLNGEIDKVVLSLVDLKAHLLSPQGIDAIYGILKAQPDCTAEQLASMAVGEQDLILCNPPESFLFLDLQPAIEAEIEAAVRLVLPDQVTLITANENRAQDLQDLKDLRAIMRLSPLMPMFCLLMITIVAVRSLGGWLNWWGYPLLFAGLFSMVLTAIIEPFAAMMFRAFVAPVFPASFPTDLLDVLESVVATIAYGAVQPTVKVAGILALIGLIMVAVAFLFRKRLGKSN